jgi:hypothetical protein
MTKLVIMIEGGFITNIKSNSEVEVLMIDCDVDGSSTARLVNSGVSGNFLADLSINPVLEDTELVDHFFNEYYRINK